MFTGEYKRVDGNVAKWTTNKEFGLLGGSGMYSKELNYVSFAGAPPAYDIRTWKETNGGKIPCKGISLTYDELKELYKTLQRFFG